MGVQDRLTADQRAHYDERGFVRLDGFATGDVCRQMHDRVIELAQAHARSHHGVPGRRGAMVFHYAATGTVDTDRNPVNDFVTVR